MHIETRTLMGFMCGAVFLAACQREIPKTPGIVVQDSTQQSSPIAPKSERQISNIQYSFPIKIYGSTHSFFKVLLVEPAVSKLFKRGGYSMDSEYDNGIMVNVVYLNSKSQDLHLLFTKPTFIRRLSSPSSRADSGQKQILYDAIIHDSNSDGIISGDDNIVLFSSELDGTDLTRITPDSLSVTRWQFADNFQSVIIEVKQPMHDPSIDEKLWTRHLFWYDLSTKKFKYQQLDVLLERSKTILGK